MQTGATFFASSIPSGPFHLLTPVCVHSPKAACNATAKALIEAFNDPIRKARIDNNAKGLALAPANDRPSRPLGAGGDNREAILGKRKVRDEDGPQIPDRARRLEVPQQLRTHLLRERELWHAEKRTTVKLPKKVPVYKILNYFDKKIQTRAGAPMTFGNVLQLGSQIMFRPGHRAFASAAPPPPPRRPQLSFLSWTPPPGGKYCRHYLRAGTEHQPRAGGGGGGRELLEGGEGTQKFVYQKRPNKTFPIVNFVFSHNGHFCLGARGSQGGTPALLLWCTAILTSSPVTQKTRLGSCFCRLKIRPVRETERVWAVSIGDLAGSWTNGWGGHCCMCVWVVDRREQRTQTAVKRRWE